MRTTARIVLCLLVIGAALGVARPAAAAAPTVSVDSGSVVEGDSGINGILFTVTVEGDRTGGVSVQYRTADVTATAKTSGNCTTSFDYLEQFSGLSFSATDSEETVLITTCGDPKDEIDETFELQLHDPSSGLTIAGGPGIGTILDDDDPPRLTASNTSVPEGNSGSAAQTVPVQLAAPSGKQVTFDFETRTLSSGARATAGTSPCSTGEDFLTTNGSGTIPAGSTTPSSPVTVPICGDTLDEANERFAVRLSNIVNADPPSSDGIVTITDNDPTTATLSVNDVTVATEPDSGQVNLRFTISVSATTGLPVTVSYATGGGTATPSATTAATCSAGIDYLRRSGSVTIPTGAPSATVDVPVCGDLLDEANETFNLDLSSPSGATISDSRGVATINDDDPLPRLSLSADRTIDETDTGRNLTFLAVLSAESGRNVRFHFRTEPGRPVAATAGTACGGGVDYVITSGDGLIPPGSNFDAVNVRICGDTVPERDEAFDFTIGTIVNATNADPTSSTTIRNDDANLTPTADAGSDFEVTSGTAFSLDGSDSSDPDGQPLGYLWEQTGGPEAVLRDETSEVAHVDGIRGPATLTFRLTVTDSAGATDVDSVTVVVQEPAPK